MRTITTCAGIGDSIWIMMKLLNSGEKFHFNIPDGSPQRGKQLFDLLPQVAESCTYVPGLSYSAVKERNAGVAEFRSIQHQAFFLEANTHLESGCRIERWLPDLDTTFGIEYATGLKDIAKAQHLLRDKQVYIGIYVSAYRNNSRHWNMWREQEWLEFILLIYNQCPEACFVIIGAEYDNDHSTELMKLLKKRKINYIDSIGQPLSVVVEMLKRMSYFVGFPSGLSILNETLGRPGIMFYPKHLAPMMNAWAHPDRIANGDYKAAQLCDPDKLFKWMKDEYKFFSKI